MTQQELDRVKLVQLEIMDEIHRLCTANDITYYLICGTALGAVRHRGFIPWDVDIDIAMPREDYARFREVCMEDLHEDYHYCDYLNTKNFPRPHALVCHKKSRIHMKYDHLNPIAEDHGIYVDVFPLDNAPDDEILRAEQAKRLKQVFKFKQYRLPYSYSRKVWKRYAHYAVSGLLSWANLQKLNHYQQELMQKYRHQQTRCICSMASQYAYSKQCMPREIYGTPTLMAFEGRQYFGPEKYQEYLTTLYGDYMQLPPVEKRRSNLEIYSGVEFL